MCQDLIFFQIFILLISNGEKVISNVNLVVWGQVKSVKIAHFWLPFAPQKRACLSSLIFWGARHAQLLCVEKLTRYFDLWSKQKPYVWVLVWTPYLLDKRRGIYFFFVTRVRCLFEGGVYLNFIFFFCNQQYGKSVKRALKYIHFELKNTAVKKSKACLSWTTYIVLVFYWY